MLSTITITHQTEGSGYVIGEREVLESLESFMKPLRSDHFSIHGIRPANDVPGAMHTCEFVALPAQLREAVEKWHAEQGGDVDVEYQPA